MGTHHHQQRIVIMETPSYCVAAGLVGLGGVAMATSFHDDSDTVTKVCVGSSLLGGGALVAALAHHGSPSISQLPPAHCIAGVAAGLGALGYASQLHENKSKSGLPPAHCILSSVGIAAAALATALFISKSK